MTLGGSGMERIPDPVLPARFGGSADGRGGTADSGHLALILTLAHAGGEVAIANTHLRRDDPDRTGENHIGWRQAIELLDVLAGAGDTVVLCGDLDLEADHEVLAEAARRGLADACATRPGDVTCNAKRRLQRIDFILDGQSFAAEPDPLPEIAADTPLPSADQPSDRSRDRCPSLLAGLASLLRAGADG